MTDEFAYSVRVKNGAGWRQFDRIRLMISVGKDYHEGEKLAAVVEWINRNPHIRQVQISVNDCLQRHNYEAAGMPQEQAGQVAMTEGALWIARNTATLGEIRPEYIYTRWRDWFGGDEYLRAKSHLLAYAEANTSFAKAMARDAHSLAERKTKRGEAVSPSLVRHSQDYVEEEMAVFALQSRMWTAAEIYPGGNLHGAAYLLALPEEEKDRLPEAIRPLASRYFTRIDFARINVSPSRVPVSGLGPGHAESSRHFGAIAGNDRSKF